MRISDWSSDVCSSDLFNGRSPEVQRHDSEQDEVNAVAAWLEARREEGVAEHEIGIFVRSAPQIDRARAAATKGGLAFKVLDEQVEIGRAACRERVCQYV